MRVAYSYQRFSSGKQATGTSLKRQTEARDSYLARHPELILDDQLRDSGVSAFHSKNSKVGALSRFLKAIEQGRVKRGAVLIVESLDRLSRDSIDDAYDLFRSIIKAGVDIITLNPERHYDKASLKNLTSLIEPLVIMSRANEESETKSGRAGAAWQKAREPNATKIGRCPFWLRLSEDKKAYVLIPEHVKLMRYLISETLAGVGARHLAKRLNAQGVPLPPNAKKAKGWYQSYIHSLLTMPALRGEWQPKCVRYEDGRKIIAPASEPIQGYYPALLSEGEFHKLQQTQKGRRHKCGPVGKQVANLFTGLIKDAKDNSPMVIITKRAKYLVSHAGMRGYKGSQYAAFRYPAFEMSFLKWLSELKAADLGGDTQATDQEADLLDAQARHSTMTAKIAKIKAKLIDDDSHLDALVEVLRECETNRKALSAEIERLTAAIATPATGTLAETQGLIATLQASEGDELVAIRTRIKQRISELVSEVFVRIVAIDRFTRVCIVQAHLSTGGVKKFKVLAEKGGQRISTHGEIDSGRMTGTDLRDSRLSSRDWLGWGSERKMKRA
jgi:DNA invertase Pin-like site-specific DNA recombinase